MTRRPYITPLQLRSSWRRIRRNCSDRRKLLWKLLYPLPWHFQPKPLPSTHDVLTANARATEPVPSASLLQRNFLQLRAIPLFCLRDTPLCSLYRLYEELCSGELVFLDYESSYFFFHNEPSWRLSQIADPKDPDIGRYTVLASFVEALVVAFNWKIEQGLRRKGTYALEMGDNDDYQLFLEAPPSWTSRVKPLAEPLDLMPLNCKDGTNPTFQKRNIKAPMGYLYSV
ncbi:hypothetical protein ISF_01804 [Cordyceps fumosorosea ARSEF 2679]|uniref:Uncharacterized protein n=1 Tax=Cordyceps fumosorosea (strain ARSEF 2679) TaxID=1081104 RepID=A0A168CDG2_CORFA|nr:hypothetical protein ISF_01804 [Cordyceps fumosorosea ARSEF 2679]OAA71253.1 hypothetical protein ISF_01804 [Cordyceps fumosorosea ARSEF 2679]